MIASINDLGANVYRVFVTYTGTPTGVEQIEVEPNGSTTIYDGNDNALADPQNFGLITLNDESAPTFTGETLAANNSYIDVTISEAVFTSTGGAGALIAADFRLDFTQNSGGASAPVIASITDLGANVYRVFVTYTGTPTGVEQIEVEPNGSTAIYDSNDNARLIHKTLA